MRKLAIILASTILAASTIGIGGASAQTTPAPAAPDATTATPAPAMAAPMKKAKPHKAAVKHKAMKKKAAPKKKPAMEPSSDQSTQPQQ